MCDSTPPLTNLTSFDNRTNFTLDQLQSYLDEYLYLQCLDSYSNYVTMHMYAISGLVGFLSYILMLASLHQSRRTLSGPTMIYHRAMIAFEFVHMLVLSEVGLMEIYKDRMIDLRTTYAYVFWVEKLNRGWHIGDWFKLAVSTLTAFLTLERCIAVCAPIKYRRINKSYVAYSAVAISLVIGSAHVWQIFGVNIEAFPSGRYELRKSELSFTTFYEMTVEFTIISRIVLCVAIFVFCLVTAIGLRRHAAKVDAALQTDTASRRDWAVTKRLCAFSFIVGVCTLVDHLAWGVYRATLDRGKTILAQDAISLGHTYGAAMDDIRFAYVAVASRRIQGWTGALMHGWRFYIYLAFNRTMRTGFRKVICGSCGRKGEVAAGGTVVSVRSVRSVKQTTCL